MASAAGGRNRAAASWRRSSRSFRGWSSRATTRSGRRATSLATCGLQAYPLGVDGSPIAPATRARRAGRATSRSHSRVARDRIPGIGTGTLTRLSLSTGDGLEVAGSLKDVEKLLQDAARSSPGTLAWLTDVQTGRPVGVNPAHVVTVTAGGAEAQR